MDRVVRVANKVTASGVASMNRAAKAADNKVANINPVARVVNRPASTEANPNTKATVKLNSPFSSG